MLVFLPDEALHTCIGLVDIGGNRGLHVPRVEDLVHKVVAMRFHILRNIDNQTSCFIWFIAHATLTSTWSDVQLSMLRDLILDIWVPIFRCRAAHRIHRNIPIC